MVDYETRVDATAVEAEHDRLHEEIDRVEAWWSECSEYGQPRFGEMGTRVQGLRVRLAEHFAREEEGGYLNDILDPVPRLAERAESLRRQHGTLLAGFDRLVERLRQPVPEFDGWEEAHKGLGDLLIRLDCHDHAETDLVQRAVCEEIAVAD